MLFICKLNVVMYLLKFFCWSITLLQVPEARDTEYFFGKKKSNSSGFHGTFLCLINFIILMHDTDVRFHSLFT